MTEYNKLEEWLKDNNISKLLQKLLDDGVSELSDLTEFLEWDESDINEFIEDSNMEESDINQFKNALLILSSKNDNDLSQNKEMSHSVADVDDKNVQYKALLKNGLNIVASKKREYVVSKLEEKESAYKGGNGYNKQVLIKTTIRDLNGKNKIQVKPETREPEKLFVDDNHKIILV
eukprot:117668_1